MSNCIRRLPANRVLAAGLVALAVANVAQWYLQRHSGWTESVTDFTSGLLQGVAIATVLLGIVLLKRKPD
jgi:hypothetical protein